MFLYLVNVCCVKYAQCVYSSFLVIDEGMFAGVIQLQGWIVKVGGGWDAQA